jgi:hypothetical protein
MQGILADINSQGQVEHLRHILIFSKVPTGVRSG